MLKFSSDVMKEMLVRNQVGPVSSKKPLQQRVTIPSTVVSLNASRPASNASLGATTILKHDDSMIGALNLN